MIVPLPAEMVYDDVFSLWETIWAAKHTSSEHFVLFVALALVETYRDIILENNMDFTDIIKFFNGKMEVSYKQIFWYFWNFVITNNVWSFTLSWENSEIKHPAKKKLH